MANGAFKFKDIYGNTLSYISGSGTNIHFSGGTLDLSGMSGITLGNLTISGSTNNADTASHAPSYLLTSSFNTYSGNTNTIISGLNTFTSSANGRLNNIEGITGSFATTGSNTFKGNQTFSGSLIPNANGVYDLGDETHQFRHLYLSSASLYIDGTKVLGSTTQELQITTDVGQSFKILEAGSDNITLQSTDGNIELKSSGGGDVIIDPTNGIIGLKGTVTIYTGNKIVSSDGNAIQFGNGITVTGSILSTVTPLVSGSSQITYGGLSGVPSGIISSSTQITSQGYAITGSNNFQGTQTITGSLYISSDLVVQGSSSLQNITASAVNIGANIVNLNTANPAIRFAGLNIFDSGSIGGSGSFLYDAVQDEFIFVHRGDGINITSSVALMGPQTYNNVGSEIYPTTNRILKGVGNEHIGDSIISETDNGIGISGSLSITGSLVATGTSLVSGSSQIDVLSTTNIARLATTGSNIFTSNQTITGSITSTSTITGTNFVTNGTTLYGVTLKGRVADNYGAIGFYSSDGATRYGYLQSHSTNGGQIIVNADGGGQLILDNRGIVATSAISGSSAIFTSTITTNAGIIGNNSNNLYLSSNSAGGEISFWGNQLNTRLVTILGTGQLGVNTVPEFPLDIKTTNASATAMVGSFHNLDYTVGTKTFIRVRTQTSAGSSYSSYFGTGQDGTLHIVANDFARGGDIKINPTTGAVTFIANVTIKSGNGDQLLLNNSGERFTQINLSNNSVSKANIWWDNTNTELVLLASSTGTGHLKIASTGHATFSGRVRAKGGTDQGGYYMDIQSDASSRSFRVSSEHLVYGDFVIQRSTTRTGTTYEDLLYFDVNRAATFSSSITATNIILNSINSVTSTAGQNIINSTYSGTDGNWFTLQNAGGILYAGLENSISTTFGATAYAGVLYLTGARNLEIFTSSAKRLTITSTGIVQPGANGTQDLGTASLRWGTVYTSDLSLSNGVGDYTIVEGENDLFLYNNKQNKVYKFLLAEVNPSEATPKKS